MHIELPHKFSQQEAVKRVNDALAKSRAQVLAQAPDFVSEWQGDTLNFGATVQGNKITGMLEIKDKQFILDAKLPLLWRMFEGRIEAAIKQQAAGML